MAPVSSITFVFTLALWAISLVDGSIVANESIQDDGDTDALSSIRNVHFLNGAGAKNNAKRHLLPHPAYSLSGVEVKSVKRRLLPGPNHAKSKAQKHSGGGGEGGSSGSLTYQGCLGLSEEERDEAWKFEGEAPPCEILVDGVVVVSAPDDDNDSSGSSSGGSSSGGSSSNGGSSGGGSSGSGGNNGGSSSNSNGDGSSSNSGSSGGGSSGNNNNSNGSGGSDSNGSSNSGGNSDGSGSSSGNGDGSDGKDERNGDDDDVNGGGGNGNNGNGGGGDDDDANAGGNGGGGDDDDANAGGNGGGGDGTYPLDYFDLSDCGTYSQMWLWDLALTCSDYSSSLEDCQCTSTNILNEQSMLYCPGDTGPTCPDGCSVCVTCMQLALGCSRNEAERDQRLPTRIRQSGAFPLVAGIVAAVATAVVGASIYQYQHRRAVASTELKAGFFGTEPGMSRMV